MAYEEVREGSAYSPGAPGCGLKRPRPARPREATPRTVARSEVASATSICQGLLSHTIREHSYPHRRSPGGEEGGEVGRAEKHL